MKTALYFRTLAFAAVACCLSWSSNAANLTITPASVPWNTTAPLVLDMAGLANHQAVLVRDPNRPGDEDGATNGLIKVNLVFGSLPERNRAIGNYLFRISSTNNAFLAVTQPFVVSQASFAQSISG